MDVFNISERNRRHKLFKRIHNFVQEQSVIRERNEYIDKNFKAERVSEREQKISHRIQKKSITDQVNQFKKCEELKLCQRRKNMDDYYVQESEKWKRQLEEMEKQLRIEKKSQLRENAHDLKESREKYVNNL